MRLVIALAGLAWSCMGAEVRLCWDYPSNLVTTGVSFLVYHTTDVAFQPVDWARFTNAPGTSRTVRLPVSRGTHLFTMTTVSNGAESAYATNDGWAPQLAAAKTHFSVAEVGQIIRTLTSRTPIQPPPLPK